MNELALSASPCQAPSPSFAMVIKPSSSTPVNGRPNTDNAVLEEFSGTTLLNPQTDTAMKSDTNYSSDKQHTSVRPATIGKNLRPKPMRCHSIDSVFPTDLSPSNHPVLKDIPRPRSSSSSSALSASYLETLTGKCGHFASSASTFSTTISSINVERQGRPKGTRPKLVRYYTTPATFEGISEIEEDLYAKQNTKEEEEQQYDPPPTAVRRASSFGGASSYLSRTDYNGKRVTHMGFRPAKTRSHSAGAVLFPSSSSKFAQAKGTSNRCKQRSHESLFQSGATVLPTIPEELRLQQQHTLPDQLLITDDTYEVQLPLQRSRSADETGESEEFL